jgi:hypothetical protein
MNEPILLDGRGLSVPKKIAPKNRGEGKGARSASEDFHETSISVRVVDEWAKEAEPLSGSATEGSWPQHACTRAAMSMESATTMLRGTRTSAPLAKR